jgi:hypothetical protein
MRPDVLAEKVIDELVSSPVWLDYGSVRSLEDPAVRALAVQRVLEPWIGRLERQGSGADASGQIKPRARRKASGGS